VSAFNPQAFASREAIASFYLKFQSIDDVEIHALTNSFSQNPVPQGIREGRAA
jgi:hypothetical protein